MRDRLLTTTEAAETFGVARSTIRQWVRRGHVAPIGTVGGHRVAGELLFALSDLARCAAERHAATRGRSSSNQQQHL